MPAVVVAAHCRCHRAQYRHVTCQSGVLSLRDRQMFERTNVGQKRGTSLWEGLSRPSPLDSPSDEGYDIFRKLSPSSLHQKMHIHEPGTRRFVAAVSGDGSAAGRANT